MTLAFRCALPLAAAAFLAACATPEPAPAGTTAATEAAGKECVTSTASIICRKPGSGGSSPVATTTAEEMRRAMGTVNVPRTGPAGR